MTETTTLHYFKRGDGGIYATGMPFPQAESDVLATESEINSHLFAETSRAYQDRVQGMLDAAAQTSGYDNITTACSYAGAPNPFQEEGQSFLAWRGAVWQHCYTALAAVQAGQRELMTIEELLAELPVREIPTTEA